MTHKHSWVVITVTLALIGAMSGMNAPNAYADGAVEDVDLQGQMATLLPLGGGNTEDTDTNGAFNGTDFDPNGILDTAEVSMIETILEDASLDLSGTGGVTHAGLHAAWTTNLAIVNTVGLFGALSVDGALNSYFLMGSVSALQFAGFIFTDNGGSAAALGGLDLGMEAFLAPGADADGDGFSNLEEWDFFGAPLLGTLPRTVHEAAIAAYVAAALDAGVFPVPPPPGVTSFTSDGGGVFTLTFDEDVTGVDDTDFEVVTTAGVTGAGSASVSGTGSVYTVTVSGTIAGDGNLSVKLLADGSIENAGGGTNAVKFSAVETIGTGPGLSSLKVPFFQE